MAGVLYTMVSCSIHASYTFPTKDVDLNLSPESIVAVHDEGTVQLELSFHQKWIASAGSDGRMLLTLVENPVSATAYKMRILRLLPSGWPVGLEA